VKADRYPDIQPAGFEPDTEHEDWREWLRARKKPLVVVALLAAGLVFAAGWNPPTTTVHQFTEASDYSARRESGCTNSGDGCHGDDARLNDFNRYHPDTECKTCHEYTGVGCIPCHGPQQHECTGCHDGSMEGASDCMRLGDPYPKGHYRASLHTATGTDMDQIVRAAAGGEAEAACSDCHADDLMDSHTGVPLVEGSEYGPEIGCAECHNDEKSGALDEVLSDWERHACEDCHGEKSPAPMHAADIATAVAATGDARCGSTGAGCHDLNDLHALHPDAPATCAGSAAEGEPGCHDLEIQSHAPTATACGTGEATCHAPYVNDDYSHEHDAEIHTASAQASAVLRDTASGVAITCGSCHSTELDSEHRRSHIGLGADSCTECHNKSETTIGAVADSWPERTSQDACARCHDEQHAGANGAHQATQLGDADVASADSCVRAGCHLTADVRTLHAAVGCTIGGCHSATGPIAGTLMTCGGTDARSGTSCHTASTRHTRITAAHAATQIDDRGVVSATGCARAGCHPSPDVRDLHASAGCSVSGCHAPGGPTYMTCGGAAGAPACHTASDTTRHADADAKHLATEYSSRTGALEAGACAEPGCHPTADVRELHPDATCSTAGCHSSGGPTYMSCGGKDGAPATACHNTSATQHQHTDASHLATEALPDGTAMAGACVRAGCHAKTSNSTKPDNDVRYVAVVSAAPTTSRAHGCYDTAGCHVADGPKGATCGGPAAAGATNCHTFGTIHSASDAQHAVSGEYSSQSGALSPAACVKAGCHGTLDARTLHAGKGCFITGCHATTPSTPLTCGGASGNPTTACHNTSATQHLHTTPSHAAMELGVDGLPQAGACTCHAAAVQPVAERVYVRSTGSSGLLAADPLIPTRKAHTNCYQAGCHVDGGLQLMSCGGGADTLTACHASASTLGPVRSPSCVIPPRGVAGDAVWRAFHTPEQVAGESTPGTTTVTAGDTVSEP